LAPGAEVGLALIEARAEALLIAITSSEVPTATGIVKPSTRTSAGTAAKPPPTPKNPVSRPTAVAVSNTFSARGHAQENAGRSVMIATGTAVRIAPPRAPNLPPPVKPPRPASRAREQSPGGTGMDGATATPISANPVPMRRP